MNNSQRKVLITLLLFNCFAGSLYGMGVKEPERFSIENLSSSRVHFAASFTREFGNISTFFPLNVNGNSIMLQLWNNQINPIPEKNILEAGTALWLFDLERTRHLGAAKKFRAIIDEFNVYDEEGHLFMTIDDIKDGRIIEYVRNRAGDTFIKEVHENEGSIRIEVLGPLPIFRNTIYTIEITDELITEGRERHARAR